MKTAIVVLADGFEEIEAVTPVDLLRRAGVRVIVAGLSGTTAVSSRGLSIGCDTVLGEVPTDWDAFILPGGLPGAQNLADSPLVKQCLDDSVKRGVWIGAICAAPAYVLGSQGFLEGRTYTGYPGTEERVPKGRYLTDPVVVDGCFVTSRGVGTAAAFGLKLVELLVGAPKSAEVARNALLG